MSSLVVVTGASQGIGRSIVEALAKEHSDWEVVIVCRDQRRGEQAVEGIINASKNSNVRCEQCDLSQWDSVKEMRDRILKRRGPTKLSVLVNNAAECPPMQELVPRNCSNGGNTAKEIKVDKQFASNVLGYHFIMHAFLQSEFDASIALVVNVASNWAGDLDMNDLHFTRRLYVSDTAYRQSKQCNRMLTREWADRMRGRNGDAEMAPHGADMTPYGAEMEPHGAEMTPHGAKMAPHGAEMTFVSCHPGDPCTKLSCSLGYNTYASKDCGPCVEKNIMPLVRAHFSAGGTAVTGNSKLVSGGWYEVGRARNCQFEKLGGQRKQLFEYCNGFIC